MPSCYLLTLCSGSSLDQHSNNVSLFNLVEQINFRSGTTPTPGTLIPLEVHAYFDFAPNEFGFSFELRFVLVSMETSLETPSDTFSYRSMTARFRTRTLGMPLPPVVGAYQLRVEWRTTGTHVWSREPLAWPIAIVETSPEPPRVTH